MLLENRKIARKKGGKLWTGLIDCVWFEKCPNCGCEHCFYRWLHLSKWSFWLKPLETILLYMSLNKITFEAVQRQKVLTYHFLVSFSNKDKFISWPTIFYDVVNAQSFLADVAVPPKVKLFLIRKRKWVSSTDGTIVFHFGSVENACVTLKASLWDRMDDANGWVQINFWSHFLSPFLSFPRVKNFKPLINGSLAFKTFQILPTKAPICCSSPQARPFD